MKQAVIQTGGKQYIVKQDQVLDIELVADEKKLDFKPLIIFDEKGAKVGTPHVSGGKVTAEVVEPSVKGEKVHVLRYKAKKRVRVLNGHRQKYTRIKITNIA